MKAKLLILSALALFLSASSRAYDFSAVNEDGITIYYEKSGSDATVTYRTASGGSYSGTLVIPETVDYNGTTYSVTAIGGWAFTGCTGLTDVTIPNSVTEIGEYAFYRCTGLSSITIPPSVVLIGNAAFADCSNISTVTIEDGTETLAFVGSIETFYQCSIKTAYQGRNTSYENHPPFWSSATLTSLTLGDNVTSIGDNEFAACTALTSMTIPASVMEIGDMAFNMCVSMTSLKIGDGVKTIGEKAFYYCMGLSSLTIGGNVTEIGNNCFQSCSALKSVTIPNSVVSLGDYSFANCAISSLTLGNSLEHIGNYAFYTCTSLRSVTIPNSVTDIGEHAFDFCINLSSLKIGTGVNYIGDNAFSNNVITSVTIPPSVTFIGEGAFAYCGSLRTLTIEDGDETLTFSTATSPNLASRGISTIYLGRNLDYDSVFSPFESQAVSTLTIGDRVTRIGEREFLGCCYFKELTIPDNVTSIGNLAFYGCTKIEDVTIGESVNSIGDEALGNCSNVANIYSKNPEPPICGEDIFTSETFENAILTVPYKAIDSYAAADVWKEFINIETDLIDGNIEESVMKLYDYGLDCQTSNIVTNVSFYIGFKVLNTSYTTAHAGGYRFGVSNNEGFIKEWISSIYETSSTHDEPIQPNWWFSIYSWQCKITSTMEMGDRIRLYYKDDDSEVWKLLTPYSDGVVWEIVLDEFTAVKDINSGGNAEAVGYYTTNGKQIPTLQRGINIVRYSDGTAKKVLVK